MNLLILNGPNLNLLGKREPEIYGKQGFESYLIELKEKYQLNIDYKQSNVEGELINILQEADGKYDGIIFNAGGYTHTSVAIGDTVAAIDIVVVEVHITNVYAREEFRHESKMAKYCKGVITGFGLKSYDLAIKSFLEA